MAFNKVPMHLGPTGGNGGRGGSIYMEGVSDLGALRQFRNVKKVAAEDGFAGKGALHDGRAGEDVVLKVPVGTVIHLEERVIEITKLGQREQVAKGGDGGRGNYLFRSSTNTSPMQQEDGRDGEEWNVRLELKYIADIGLVGLPNVGKSSFLNAITNASAKVANYPFTTLEPNLGVYYDLVLADIPGLIEGASTGKGLGVKFLRHVERTNTIFHFVAADSESPVNDYKIVRDELKAHNPELLDKKEYIVISRADMVDKDVLKGVKKSLAAIKDVLVLSILDDGLVKGMRNLLDQLNVEKITA